MAALGVAFTSIDFSHLARVSGADHITLITCTPYGINSHRLLVRAHSVPYDAAADAELAPLMSMDWSIQFWMWLRFAIAGLALLMLLMMTIGWIRTDRRERRQAKDRK